MLYGTHHKKQKGVLAMKQNNQNTHKQQNKQAGGQNNSRYSFPDERERRDGPGGEGTSGVTTGGGNTGSNSCGCSGQCNCCDS